MLSYARTICEDPVRRGLLYVGTENAIYVSFDDGANWQPLQNNLPHAPVSWITVQEHFNDLVISTYGRGFWILDQKEEVVRTLSAPASAGLNRVHWDLRYEPTGEIRMRTSPLIPAPHVRLGPQGWRAPAGGGAAISILAPPGTYTVKLSAGGSEQTQPLTVRKDPHTAGTEADIQAQTEMLFDLRRDLNTAIDVLNRSELVRSQLDALGRVVDDRPVRKAADDLNKAFVDLEMTLIDLRITGGQDGVRYAAKLISRFGYLANGLSNADFTPTNQQAEVQKLLADRVRDTVTRFDALVAKELAGFNDLLRSRNIQHIVAK